MGDKTQVNSEEKLLSLKKGAPVPPFAPSQETLIEREERILTLFKSFLTTPSHTNLKQEGITAEDIKDRFDKYQVKGTPGLTPTCYAQELLKVADRSKDGIIDYDEFRKFVLDQESALWSLFKQIDVSQDLRLQPNELASSLKRAGVEVNADELADLVAKMDTDGDGTIDFAEWRNFLLFLPRDVNLLNIYQYTQNMNLMTSDGDISVLTNNNFDLGSKLYYLVAGGVAGVISRTATAPLDRLKIFLQTRSNFLEVKPASSSLVQTVSGWARAVQSAMYQIYKEGGYTNFYRGNGLNIIKIIPESAMKFYAFETAKSYLLSAKPKNTKELTSTDRLLAGGIAGLASQTLIYPLELIKTRRMATLSAPDGVMGAARSLIQEHGLKSLFKGLTPTLIGVFPFAAIDLALFETLKLSYLKRNGQTPDARPNVMVLLGCGMVSGTVGAVAVYPLSLIRTRLQAQGTQAHPQTYTGAFDVIRQTYQKESFKGFYKGLTPTLLKVVPAVSISYVVYEKMKKQLSLN